MGGGGVKVSPRREGWRQVSPRMLVGMTHGDPMLDGGGGPGQVPPQVLQNRSGLEHSKAQSQGGQTKSELALEGFSGT